MYMTTDDRKEQYKTVHAEAFDWFVKKNTDYGDAFADYGPVGVIVRMGDKIRRLNSVSKSGVSLVNNESIRDTLLDLHNYSAMAIMLVDENPKSEYFSIHHIYTKWIYCKNQLNYQRRVFCHMYSIWSKRVLPKY